jgi:ABC-2 type transport system permease protein
MTATIAPALPRRGSLSRGARETWRILGPKLRSARARAHADGTLRRTLVLLLAGAGCWAIVFEAVLRVLRAVRDVPGIGALLAAKLLGMVLLSALGFLLLASILTALSTFFLAHDLDFIVASPVHWGATYAALLAETAVSASWMVVLMALPVFAAYGVAYDGGPWFPLVALGALVPFLVIPAAMGTAITLILVFVMPPRRTRALLGAIAAAAGIAAALVVRLARPEQLVQRDARSLADFLAALRTPSAPWLPSEWVQRSVLGWLRYDPDVRPLAWLWLTAAALVAAGAVLHRAFYARAYSRAREGGEVRATTRRGEIARRVLAFLPVRRRELVLKEVRFFARDATQWSQLLLLVVVVAVYVLDVRFLPLQGAGVAFFVANVVPFLNLALAGFILAAVAVRLVFPGVSLEGRTWWLLRASPLAMRELLWVKFWVGAVPLVALALGIVAVTDVVLHVTGFMTALSVATVTFIGIALAALAVSAGTLFPRFEAQSAAQIPTSFGGVLYMMAATVLIGAVIMLEAGPVYLYLSARSFGGELDVRSMVAGLLAAGALCAIATVAPLRFALRRLERIER